MKNNNKKLKVNAVRNNLIRTCPVCGFTFKSFDPKTRKKQKRCPMCGHNIIETEFLPKKPNEFDKPFF